MPASTPSDHHRQARTRRSLFGVWVPVVVVASFELLVLGWFLLLVLTFFLILSLTFIFSLSFDLGVGPLSPASAAPPFGFTPSLGPDEGVGPARGPGFGPRAG